MKDNITKLAVVVLLIVSVSAPWVGLVYITTGEASASFTGGYHVYAQGQRVYVYDGSPDQTQLWVDNTGGQVASVDVSQEHNIIVAGASGSGLRIYDLDGNVILNSTHAGFSSYIDDDGNVYTNDDGELYSYDSSGNLNWQTTFDDSFTQAAYIADAGTYVYVKGPDGIDVISKSDGTIVSSNNPGGKVKEGPGDSVYIGGGSTIEKRSGNWNLDGSISVKMWTGFSDGDYLYALDGTNNKIYKIDSGLNNIIWEEPYSGTPADYFEDMDSTGNNSFLVPAGSNDEYREINKTDGSIIRNWTLPYNEQGYQSTELYVPPPQYTITGDVKNSTGEPVDSANVTLYNATDDSVISNTTTNSDGNYTFVRVEGDYYVSASKFEYSTENSSTFTLNDDYAVPTITLTKKDYELTIYVPGWFDYGQTEEYRVYFNGEPVTDNATVISENTTLFTVDNSSKTITSTTNNSTYGEAIINATYTTTDGKTLNAEKNITVSPLTPEFIDILPPLYKTIALTQDIDIQYLFLTVIAGVGATILVSSLAGVGSVLLLIIGGWIAGWVSLGLVFAALFGGMLIMMNTNAGLYNGRFR